MMPMVDCWRWRPVIGQKRPLNNEFYRKTLMHRIFITLLLILSTSALAQKPADIQSNQYEQEHNEVIKMFRTETGFEEIDRGAVLQFIDKKHSRVFLVTKPGHPAHPAVVTRQAVEQDGQLFVRSNGIGRGDQNALKTWIDYLDSEGKRAVDLKRQEAGKR